MNRRCQFPLLACVVLAAAAAQPGRAAAAATFFGPTPYLSSADVGAGRGELDGNLLRLSMSFQVNGQAPVTANCNLQLAADRASMVGQCLGPNGAFAAQLFR